jgi:pyruvate/2-oxoglutarate dehydrogenase complex dihydrolipoamide acyltransferase (E2) component
MKARMNELGLHAADLAGIAGSGAAGRVTVDDFEKFVAKLEEHKLSQASSMRVAVADAMRRSWTRPLATVGMSVVLESMLAHRKTSDPKPGPALYALRALAVALAENSAPAGRLVGDKIVHPQDIDVGFAVEAEDGVLVPVLRKADATPLREMVDRYNELVELARQRRLPPNAQGRLNRHRDQLRHLRPRMGDAHSPARANHGARPRLRPHRAALGQGQTAIRPRDRSPTHPQL